MKRLVLLARAAVILAASRLLIARRGTTEALRSLSAVRISRGGSLEGSQALWAVRRAGRVVGGACLPQSVALTVLLGRHGEAPALILGCSRTADGSWTAHAWVELHQDVLEPVRANTHTALARLEAANGWAPSPLRSSSD